jgi:hypothetical protein
MWRVYERNPDDLRLAKRFHSAVDECQAAIAEFIERYALPLGESDQSVAMDDGIFKQCVAMTSSPHVQVDPKVYYDEVCDTAAQKQAHRRLWLETLLGYTSRFHACPNRPVREVELETARAPQQAYQALAAKVCALATHLAALAEILGDRGDALSELKAKLPLMRAELEERRRLRDENGEEDSP